jgi:hypothetical protein
MGTLTPPELFRAWQREDLTAEMAIGQLIQTILKLETALTNLNLTLYQLRADVDSLIAHSGLPPTSPGRKSPPK